jgi:superfamily II DNA or RNA helicase
MNQTKGYIYVRTHYSYEVYNACKLGKASNIPERDSQYATGEIVRGCFEVVFELDNNIIMSEIEKNLQCKFRDLNIKKNAGTEFYSKRIIELIEPYFISIGLKYKKLSNEEISKLIRSYRIQKSFKKIMNSFITYSKNNKYIPRKDQAIIIEKAVKHFHINNKGILVLMCGVGKTLISLWITQQLKLNTIVIGVPNTLLLKQWEQSVHNIFNSIPCLIVSGGINNDTIMNFIENNRNKCIIITTYSSAHKVYSSTQQINFTFKMGINDEVHHLTTNNLNNLNEDDKKTYVKMLKINCEKRLSLTATLKLLENKENLRDDEIIVSNDSIEFFGEIIERKSLLWTIRQNIICDYVIQSFITNEEKLEQQFYKFNIVEDNDKRLFLSAFASLKSIYEYHSHHLLIYSNDMKNSSKLVEYIKLLLNNNYFEIEGLYYSKYHSEMKPREQKNILYNFEQAKFGIITCVYCLGEGWDFPMLDAVVFSENMSSNIRIVQSALRASRKNKSEPNKITKIILPILNRDDWLENNNNSDLKKARQVIYQMGLEDETIEHKIQVFKINVEKHKSKPKPNHSGYIMVTDFGEYDDEITRNLKLKTVKRCALDITYEKAKKIIAEKNIRSKEKYYELCENDNRLSKDPETIFKGQFTNWIDYLSIERIYYDLETCKNKLSEHLSFYPELKKYYLELPIIVYKLCKIDKNFPPNDLWVEYYNVKELSDIIKIINVKKKSGVIL